MGLLQEVKNEQARAKIGVFGSQGSGKTTTAFLMAIGLSKTYHNGAPIAMQDTENGSDYLKPIADAEGVKLLVVKSGAFVDMVTALKEAEKAGCCVFIMDSVTHTWRELQEAYTLKKMAALKTSYYRLQFQDWAELKRQWATWTSAFLNSQLHCVVAGRAGNEYEYQEDEVTHKKELIKGNTKMKAEGEFGYEPSLLIEMEAVRGNTDHGKGGNFIHMAHVLKDRTRFLNGKSFQFTDLNNYKAGDYKKVFKAFEPHFRFLEIGGTQKAMDQNSSEELFDDAGNSDGYKRQQARKIALEEIENLMGVVLWPGSTTEMKQTKLAVLNQLFGVRAWSAVEAMSLRKIEDSLWALQEYEKEMKHLELKPETLPQIVALVEFCSGRVAKPGYLPGPDPSDAPKQQEAVA